MAAALCAVAMASASKRVRTASPSASVAPVTAAAAAVATIVCDGARLPNEAWALALSFLDMHSQLNSARMCRGLASLVRQHRALMQEVVARYDQPLYAKRLLTIAGPRCRRLVVRGNASQMASHWMMAAEAAVYHAFCMGLLLGCGFSSPHVCVVLPHVGCTLTPPGGGVKWASGEAPPGAVTWGSGEALCACADLAALPSSIRVRLTPAAAVPAWPARMRDLLLAPPPPT